MVSATLETASFTLLIWHDQQPFGRYTGFITSAIPSPSTSIMITIVSTAYTITPLQYHAQCSGTNQHTANNGFHCKFLVQKDKSKHKSNYNAQLIYSTLTSLNDFSVKAKKVRGIRKKRCNRSWSHRREEENHLQLSAAYSITQWRYTYSLQPPVAELSSAR